MPRLVKEMSAIEVSRLRHGKVKGVQQSKRNIGEPTTAYHSVGGVQGLVLQCRPPVGDNPMGARSWILRITVAGKRHEMGLGSFPSVTLAKARERAREIKGQIAEGTDPIAQKNTRKSALLQKRAKAITFSQVADEYIDKKAKEFKTPKQKQQLLGRLNNYILPIVGNVLIADIDLSIIETILRPIWDSKNETADRVRRDIEKIIDLATVKGLKNTNNPARWKGFLDQVFSAPNVVSKHNNFPALAVIDLPSFWRHLCKVDTIGSLALQFQILTAARSGAVRLASWNEFDLKEKIWTLPAKRASAKVTKDHKVPLTETAIAILDSIPEQGQYPFSVNGDKSISDGTVGSLVKRLHNQQRQIDGIGYIDKKQEGKRIVPHGFRSTFKDWSLEYTSYPDEITELALSHVNSDKTRAAYARSQMVEKRRYLMQEWERYCCGN